jgi:hypothetical protein
VLKQSPHFLAAEVHGLDFEGAPLKSRHLRVQKDVVNVANVFPLFKGALTVVRIYHERLSSS